MNALRSRVRSAIDLGAAIGMILVAGIVVWRLLFPPPQVLKSAAAQVEPVPTEPIAIADAFAKGNDSAPVAILEFADLQCPACAVFANNAYKSLVTEFVNTGRVKMLFKHFPLPKHPLATSAAIAAQCAGEQSMFWPFYEKAFLPDSQLSDQSLLRTAKALELEISTWEDCRKGRASATTVAAHSDLARKLRLRGTPAFIIGTQMSRTELHATALLYGAKDIKTFADAIAAAEKETKRATQ